MGTIFTIRHCRLDLRKPEPFSKLNHLSMPSLSGPQCTICKKTPQAHCRCCPSTNTRVTRLSRNRMIARGDDKWSRNSEGKTPPFLCSSDPPLESIFMRNRLIHLHHHQNRMHASEGGRREGMEDENRSFWRASKTDGLED